VAGSEGRPIDTVVPISTATNTAGKPIRIGGSAEELAITPDGKTLYAVTPENTVVPISTATNTPGPPIPVRYGVPNGIVTGIVVKP
jgi:DNA-binding beta-propeller fold protein YncE